MVISYKLFHGKISFPYESEYDFVNNLCALSRNDDGYHWIMDEPLVIETVEKVLKKVSVDPSFMIISNN
jgi:hypothetical protein